MIISIFASIGAQNLGDELILKNEINILRNRYKTKKPKFIVFSYDYKKPFYISDDIEYKEYFPINSSNISYVFRNIKNFILFLGVVFKSKLIVVGGGGIFYDNEIQSTRSPLDLWIFRINVFKIFRKKIGFFRVGISIKEEESFEKIQKIFSSKKSAIVVRDNYSFKVLNDLGFDVKKELDPVFFDNGVTNFNKKISIKKIYNDFSINDIKSINFNSKTVGIAFRSGYISNIENPELEILMFKEIIEYIQKFGGNVILLPHSFHKTDILANDYEWMKLIQNKTKDVILSKSMQETYNYYREDKLDVVLAQRLHSIILSQVYEIPFVGISYSRKTEEILKELK